MSGIKSELPGNAKKAKEKETEIVTTARDQAFDFRHQHRDVRFWLEGEVQGTPFRRPLRPVKQTCIGAVRFPAQFVGFERQSGQSFETL